MISKMMRTFLALDLSLVNFFMKIHSVVIEILVIIPLSIGGGVCCMNDFQSVKETCLSQDRSLIKFSWRYGAWQRCALYR